MGGRKLDFLKSKNLEKTKEIGEKISENKSLKNFSITERNGYFPNFPGYFSTTVIDTFTEFPHSLHL